MKTLTIERLIYAPITKIWDAFTDADQLKQWWSPQGMSCSHASIELKAGGLFRYCFKTQDGNEFWGRGVYQNVKQPSQLSYLDTFTDATGQPVPPSHFGIPGDDVIETLVEFSFVEEGENTKLKMVGENYYDDAMTDDLISGWNSMFDKLESFLIKN